MALVFLPGPGPWLNPSPEQGINIPAGTVTTVDLTGQALSHTRALGAVTVSPQILPAALVRTRAQGALKVNPQILPASIVHTRALGTTYIAPRPAGLVHTRAQGALKVNPQLKPAAQTHTRAQGALKVNATVLPASLAHTRALGTTAVIVRISPAGLAHTRAQGSLKVNPQLKPAALAHTRAQGTITVAVGFFVSPASLAHTRAQGSPVVSPQLRPASLTHTRALGTTALTTPSVRQLGGLIVTVAWIPRPAGLEHVRAQGAIVVHGRATILPDGQQHTRAQGNPTLSARVLPPSTVHARAQGTPSVNPRTISPTGLIHSRTLGRLYRDTITAETGLAGYWRLGEPSGTNAADELGLHNGVYVASPTLGVTGALIGDTNTAVTFPTTTSVTVADNNDAFDFGAGAFSLECWIKRTAPISQFRGLLARGTGSWYLRFNASNQLELLRENQASLGTSTGTLTDTTGWHHIVVTRTAGGVTRFYIDGSDVGGFTGGTINTVASTTLTIAANSSPGTNYLIGSMDEIAIYSVALTPTQVSDHYTVGTSPSGLAVTTVSIVRPTGQTRTRVLGDPVTRGLTTIGPASLTRTRAQGIPVLSGRALPASLVHTRAQGAPAVNVRQLAPLALARA